MYLLTFERFLLSCLIGYVCSADSLTIPEPLQCVELLE